MAKKSLALLQFSLAFLLLARSASAQEATPEPLAPIPELAKAPDPGRVELGRLLFFDGRLSGDRTVSCASCHKPLDRWTDGLALSEGYPGSRFFRNTPTVLNSAHRRSLYWDGRMSGKDLPTLVRDHLSEAHFMQVDGELMIERLRQAPEYEASFRRVFGGEPSYGRTLDAVAAYVSTLRSEDAPIDRFLRGERGAISEAAASGKRLFEGKAGCIGCHGGPMLTDESFHDLGLPTNREIVSDPLRHITLRRFFRTLGLADYAHLRDDVGRYAITRRIEDLRRFRTPSLREVAGTPPYMHDGSLGSLRDVIDFYAAGAGPREGRDARLAPIALSEEERDDLVEFLNTLSGAAARPFEPPALPSDQLRPLGEN